MRVLVIEDDPEVSAYLNDDLEAEGWDVVLASTAAVGVERLREEGWDAIVVDIGLPDGDGLGILSDFRNRGGTVPVIMLTALSSESEIIRGLDAGADDYLTKPYLSGELLARLRAITRRGEGATNAGLSLGDLSLDRVERLLCWRNRSAKLTDVEARIVHRLLRQPEQVVPTDDLMRAAFGLDFDPGTGLLAVHISNLRKKLRSRGLPEFVQTEWGVGYFLSLSDTAAP